MMLHDLHIDLFRGSLAGEITLHFRIAPRRRVQFTGETGVDIVDIGAKVKTRRVQRCTQHVPLFLV